MLQSIRDRSRGWLVHAIVVSLVLVFTFWGLHGLLGQQAATRDGPVVVRVAGLGLSQHDFESAYQRLYRQAQRHLGTDASLDEQVRHQLKEQTLKQWVFLQLLSRAARQANYRVNQAEMDSVLLGIPEFQVDGRFSSPRFYALLDALAYTETRFFGDLRKSLLIRQVQQGLTKTAFFLPGELDRFVAHLKQTRSIAYTILSSRRFSVKQLPVSDAQALAYYEAHKQQFTSSERVRVSYVRLSSSSESNVQGFAAARDRLADLAYIHPNSLDLVAKHLGLGIQYSAWFDRTVGNDPLTKNPRITEAAFSEEVLRGHNSSVIDLDANTALVLRVQEHQVPFVQPFVRVKGHIIQVLRTQLAKEKTREMGEALLKRLRAQKVQDASDQDMMGLSSGLQWRRMHSLGRYTEGISSTLLNTVFALPPVQKGKATIFGGAALANGDYLLVKLLSVQPGKTSQLSASDQKMYRAALKESFGQLDYALYADDILKKAPRA